MQKFMVKFIFFALWRLFRLSPFWDFRTFLQFSIRSNYFSVYSGPNEFIFIVKRSSIPLIWVVVEVHSFKIKELASIWNIAKNPTKISKTGKFWRQLSQIAQGCQSGTRWNCVPGRLGITFMQKNVMQSSKQGYMKNH